MRTKKQELPATQPQGCNMADTKYCTKYPLSDAKAQHPLRIVNLGHTKEQSLRLRSLGLSTRYPIRILERTSPTTCFLANGNARVAVDVNLAKTILVKEIA
ncbi:ferrous iron transport protein A [Flexibacterium corallicola]|uniref:ferrous iron transport protein A n=1 Tax=Flexibacterium corallicola TaxID=3037259 RepID=UPI00286F7669|nr:ferrous iron transport protein A [Pseudovibrio sp. M1P-2-3]